MTPTYIIWPKILKGEEADQWYKEHFAYGCLPNENVLGDAIEGIIPEGEAI